MIGYLGEYAGKKLRNAGKGDLDVEKPDEAETEKRKEAEQAADGVVGKLKALLGERVGDVRVSHRLIDSPSVLVLGEHDMALHMQRLLREAGHDVPASPPVLEINPSHPLVKRIEERGRRGAQRRPRPPAVRRSAARGRRSARRSGARSSRASIGSCSADAAFRGRCGAAARACYHRRRARPFGHPNKNAAKCRSKRSCRRSARRSSPS